MATGTIIFPVQAAKLTATNPAQIDGSQLRFYLLFDATTPEAAQYQFRMPANYASGLTAKLQYAMVSGTTGGVAFEASMAAITDGDTELIESASFDAVNIGSATVTATAGLLDEISITMTNADSVAANDLVVLNVARNPTLAGDTVTGDCELANISLEYTTT